MRLFMLLVTVLLLAGCSSHGTGSGGYHAEGKASWYGARHHGKRTASGEKFNQHALTAAHRSLPFGTRVRVTNLNNGKRATVRINDRGPFQRGRIIDVSRAAAERLGLVQAGVAPVRIETLD